MESITIWTRQHENVLRQIKSERRYTAKRRYRYAEPLDTPTQLREAQDWLARRSPFAASRPEDADYPIWVSISEESAMPPQEGSLLLRLTVDKALVTSVNIAKWGAILNYSYIPADEQDAKRHLDMLVYSSFFNDSQIDHCRRDR